jgi:predicted nuclease of predicted toxin-antitoxin system
MKPLFDQMLSSRLPRLLDDLFPDASHVSFHALDRTDDTLVRLFAAANGFTIFTKDTDYQDLAIRLGIPPKIVLVRLGNCPARRVEAAVRTEYAALVSFHTNPAAAVYELM